MSRELHIAHSMAGTLRRAGLLSETEEWAAQDPLPEAVITLVVAYAHGEVISQGTWLQAHKALMAVRERDESCTVDPDVPLWAVEPGWPSWAPVFGAQPAEDARLAWRESMLPFSLVDTMLDAATMARYELREYIRELCERLRTQPADPAMLSELVAVLD